MKQNSRDHCDLTQPYCSDPFIPQAIQAAVSAHISNRFLISMLLVGTLPLVAVTPLVTDRGFATRPPPHVDATSRYLVALPMPAPVRCLPSVLYWPTKPPTAYLLPSAFCALLANETPIRPTCYLLPSVLYWPTKPQYDLPATFCLPLTAYLLPAAVYRLPSVCCLMSATYVLLGIVLPVSVYLLPAAAYRLPSLPFAVSAFRCLSVLGVFAFGVWRLAFWLGP